MNGIYTKYTTFNEIKITTIFFNWRFIDLINYRHLRMTSFFYFLLLFLFSISMAMERDPLIQSFMKYTNTPLSMVNDIDLEKEFSVYYSITY